VNILFLSLWLVHTGISGFKHVRKIPLVFFPETVLQGIVLSVAAVWAWNQALLTRYIWSPFDISLGIVTGHVLFFFALLITHRQPGDVFRLFLSFRDIFRFVARAPLLCVRLLGLCLVEELVYRVAGQSILIQLLPASWLAVILTAVFFSVMHGHFFRSGWVSAIEFFLFSLVIGALYAFTWSISIVVFVHFIRNLESTYLDYVSLVQDGIAPEDAVKTIENSQNNLVLEAS
jgi:membrane protease YdiL (CAAX protease family)